MAIFSQLQDSPFCLLSDGVQQVIYLLVIDLREGDPDNKLHVALVLRTDAQPLVAVLQTCTRGGRQTVKPGFQKASQA